MDQWFIEIDHVDKIDVSDLVALAFMGRPLEMVFKPRRKGDRTERAKDKEKPE